MATFKTRIFKTGGGQLRIVVKPGTPLFEGGVKVGDRPGVYADFVNGEFATDDKDVIAKLRSLQTFGADFYEVTDEEKNATNSDSGNSADGNGSANEPDPRAELEKLTKQQLQELADERGVALDPNLKKAGIIDALIKNEQE